MSDDPITDLTRYRRSRDLATRAVADETILVPIRGEIAHLQQIFVLNPVAAFVWERLDGTRSLASIRGEIVASYEVSEAEARRDLHELVETFASAGLIERAGADDGG